MELGTLSAIIREEPEPAGRLRPELPLPVRWGRHSM